MAQVGPIKIKFELEDRPLAILGNVLTSVERAMVEEGVPDRIRERVRNRVIYGNPDGIDARVEVRRVDYGPLLASGARDPFIGCPSCGQTEPGLPSAGGCQNTWHIGPDGG